MGSSMTYFIYWDSFSSLQQPQLLYRMQEEWGYPAFLPHLALGQA